MAFPLGWPPRPASGRRSIRFFASGGPTTALFSDNAYLFISTGNTFQPTPYIPPGGESITAILGDNQTPGSPMGTGRDAHDADYAPAVPAGSNAPPVAMIWAYCIRIFNDGGSDLEFTFDGTNVQGVVKAGKFAEYLGRHEAGVAVRGAGGTSFRIEAW